MSDAAAPRKINLLIVVAGLGIGGAEVVIQRIAQTIDRARFNLLIACLKVRGSIGDELVKQGVEIEVISTPGKKVDYFTSLKLLRLIRRRRIDVVHTHSTDALLESAFCKLLMPRIKLVHTFHYGNYPHLPKKRMLYERLGSRIASHLVAVGEVQRQTLIDCYKLRDSHIGKVWNGVMYVPKDDGRAFREKLGLKPDQVLIGTLATLIEQKGLFDLLAIAKQLQPLGDRVRFVIVGEGKLRPKLEERRRELGLDESVILAGWVGNAAEVALPGFDIFLQPSLWEAMSIALLEAMIAAKPVVATRVGEAPYMVDEGRDGYLLDARDVPGMAAALRRLVDDPDLRQRMGAVGAAKAKNRFMVEHMTRAYEDIYSAGFSSRAVSAAPIEG
jgi:glycosyltransferase involved in cell wall biosynthesis